MLLLQSLPKWMTVVTGCVPRLLMYIRSVHEGGGGEGRDATGGLGERASFHGIVSQTLITLNYI
jgi:hypothetical protein